MDAAPPVLKVPGLGRSIMSNNETASAPPPESDVTAGEGDVAHAAFTSDPFFNLGLAPTIVDDIAAQGLTDPTPIQRDAIPAILEGRDLIGLAQTGTGKTAAYLLPLLNILLDRRKAKLPRHTSILVLVPTRELAYQVSDSIKAFSTSLKVRYLTICGGERYDFQIRALKKGVDIIVATPGRFEDLQAKGKIDLGQIEHFVLDEGDQMIDLGFLPPIRRIFEALPEASQTVFFSATMPDEMKSLAETFLSDPVVIRAARAGETVDAISQRAILVQNSDKRDVLFSELGKMGDEQALVFVRTRLRADELARWLTEKGIDADALHGDMRQYIRQKVLRRFKTGGLRVLVATDVAARGIDVSGLGMVVNFDLPEMVESYVHRIGRTGRAGQAGTALSICSVADQEKLSAVLAHVGQRLEICDSDGNVVTEFRPERAPKRGRGRGRPPRHGRDGGRRPGGSHGKPSGKFKAGPRGKPEGKSADRSSGKSFGGPADGGAGKHDLKPTGKPTGKPGGKSTGKPKGKWAASKPPAGKSLSGKPKSKSFGASSGKPHHAAGDGAKGRAESGTNKDGRGKGMHGKAAANKDQRGKDRDSGVLTLPGGGKPGKPKGGTGKPRGPRAGSSGARRGGQQRQDGGMRPLRRRRSP
jgi:superfamily II DNA/RNA helicase